MTMSRLGSSLVAAAFLAGLAMFVSGCATRGALVAEAMERRSAGRAHEMRALELRDSLDSAVNLLSNELERLRGRVEMLEASGDAAVQQRMLRASLCARGRADADEFLIRGFCRPPMRDGREGAYR